MPRAQKGIGRQGKKHKRPAEFDIHRQPKVHGTSAAPPATSKPVQASTAIEEEEDPAGAIRETLRSLRHPDAIQPWQYVSEPHPRYSDGKPLLPGYRGTLGGYGEEKWDPDQPPLIPSDERPDKVFGSVVAAEAVAAARLLERAFPSENPEDSDYEDEFEDEETRSESIEVARIKYKHALRRLAAEFPELMIPPGLHAGLDASEQETRPCPCGAGKLSRWPWALQTVCLGFCPSSHKYIDWSKLGSYEDLKYDDAWEKHRCEMLKWRDEWMLAAQGGERICDTAW